MSVANKTVLITGASQGIGADAARVFAKSGAKVVLMARSADKLAALATEIGDAAYVAVGDVSRVEDVKAAIDLAVAATGQLDVVINNAGLIDPIGMMSEMDPGDWDKVIDVNLKGVFYAIRLAAPIMQAQGGGSILTVSSGAAHGPMVGWSHYCTSKAGAAMITRCADAELQSDGLRIMGLSPGTVATEMQVKIKASGFNAVSKLDPSVHIPAEWPARALLWMCSADADEFLGKEISLRDDEIRRRVGLI
jgi:NAD(P)-dependent dehydrogenase (short-subunit alcohol dehydrogenase family)